MFLAIVYYIHFLTELTGVRVGYAGAVGQVKHFLTVHKENGQLKCKVCVRV